MMDAGSNSGDLVVSLADVTAEGKTYLFKPWFPSGKLTMLAGDPGTGKTKLADAIAALVSSGQSLCGVPCEQPGPVIIFSTEDDPGDHLQTVKACGGDLSKVYVVSDSEAALDALAKQPLLFGSSRVEAAIEKHRPSLVIFDPFQQYAGKIDSNRDTDTNQALAPVVKYAKKYGCSVVIIFHNGKSHDRLQHKAIGSTNLVGQMRSALSIVQDPEKPSEILAIHMKSNNRKGQTVRYRIAPVEGNEDYATVELLGLEDYTERDYHKAIKRAEQAEAEREITDADPVVAAILQLINDNPRGVRIGRADLANTIDKVSGVSIDLGLESVCKKYGQWLTKNHSIMISTRSAQYIPQFRLMGETLNPVKPKDRFLDVRRVSNTKLQSPPTRFQL